MEQIFSKLNFITNGEGFTDITDDLNLFIQKSNFHFGILNLTSLHTSCSLAINDNRNDCWMKSIGFESKASRVAIDVLKTPPYYRQI